MNDIYTVSMRDIEPMGAPNGYTDAKKINALLRATDPGAVAESGRSYQNLARTYGEVADHLFAMRDELLDAWHGQDAAAAQSQLREVWAAATTMRQTASSFGVAVERHGSESLWWYKYQMPSSTDLGEAQNWMIGANERITESWNAMPTELSTTLPPPPKHGHYSPPATDPRLAAGGGSAGGGSVPSAHGPLSAADHHTSGPSVSGGGADLAGFSAPGSQPSLSGGLATGGGGLPSGLGTPSGLPGTGGLDAGGVIGRAGGLSEGVAQNAAIAEEAQAAEAAAAASRPGLVAPMIGGAGAGGGHQEQERRRENWLAEDQETWDGEDVAPQVIRNEPEPEPEIVDDADVSEDDDIADLLGELNDEEPADPAVEIAALRAKLERLERKLEANESVASTENTDGLGWMSGDDT